jgi:FkbM family methyltransferase
VRRISAWPYVRLFPYFYSLRVGRLMKKLKRIIRWAFVLLHLDVTKNMKYDRMTTRIMKRVLTPSSGCIDAGCHKGEMLRTMLRYAPQGKHFAFEPIPYLYRNLCTAYESRANIYPFALADTKGMTTFQLVKNAPAYSGMKKRRYDIAHPDIEEIEVEMQTLDEVIPEDASIDFVKIDVEGAEFVVLKGGKKLLKRCRPVIIFECGKGGSDYYGTNPADVYAFLKNETGHNIFLLSDWLKRKPPLTEQQFNHYFDTNEEYYFLAYPSRGSA